ncbi:MAG: DUF433 domain-containing protein [Planctomycetaceae bacterium]|jgi:uncharacterized protein (DUF433 family)|nr:DUF433 domain-containing protein [Phycisphaerales bacterium]MCE2651996.1 DUF433 domain-containing protein [Planctomycetaceae bacterium]
MEEVAHSRIEIDRQKCHGRPVIRGTRVPVAVITGSLAAGMSKEAVAAEYDVTMADIEAALRYATELLERQRRSPLSD